MDLLLVQYENVAEATNVALAGTTTLDITGAGFRDVSRVLINGYASPSFVVASPQRIFADLPNGVTRVQSIQVLTAAIGDAATSVISFSLGTGKFAGGTARMVQSFMVCLLTSPGDNLFLPNYGGGLRDILKTTISSSADVRARVAQAVARAEATLVANLNSTKLAPDEKLVSATLVAADFNPVTTALSIQVRLRSAARETVELGTVVT
jgi:phage baseplate assembly protein W